MHIFSVSKLWIYSLPFTFFNIIILLNWIYWKITYTEKCLFQVYTVNTPCSLPPLIVIPESNYDSDLAKAIDSLHDSWILYKWHHELCAHCYVSCFFYLILYLWDMSDVVAWFVVTHSHYCIVFLCRNRPQWIHFTLDEHLGCFQFGVPVNNATLNIPVHVFWDILFNVHLFTFLLGISLGVELLVTEYKHA